MKAFIQHWIFLFGLVVISAFVVPAIFNGVWDNAWFIFKLLITTLTVCLFNLLMENLPVRIPLLKHFISIGVILAIVFIYGWIWKWYTLSSFWIVFAMVIPVYMIVVLLDAVKIRHDVAIINKHIQSVKQKAKEEKQND